MADCQMCWNDWQTLQATPFPAVDPKIEVCRNCGRSMKQVIAFVRSKGFELATISHQSGVIETTFPGPQAGPKLLEALAAESATREEEPPNPPEKGVRKRL